MPKLLPPRPNLEQLRNQAKDLLKSLKSGDPEAIKRIQENHPRWSRVSGSDICDTPFSLSEAQLVIDSFTARIPSWQHMPSSAARWWTFTPPRAWA
ncbi:MAG: hypothetical protein DME21_03600 [Verrucomicrobia bacterium]|nr:MAG: hypothetical protein DME21_03600 [Verrucomicrobiota bacterium]